MTNPWENITFGSQRRIDSDSAYNYFWIADASGRYGLFIQTDNVLPQIQYMLRLKGISVINRNNTSGKGELILILNSNDDWELFLKICTDLVKASEKCINEDRMINAVYSRLKKWQSFLKQNSNTSLTLSEQMGLFTELVCLIEHIMPHHSKEQLITSWTGADFDKQDFSLDNKLVEVKSYITSKGAFVTVSSLHQLDNSNKPLYLLVYGLTISTTGLSVTDMVESIENHFLEDPENLERFQEKLALHGYINGITEPPFHKFQIDRQVAFFVDDNFPKITSASVPQEIISVVYTLDVAKCMDYKVEVTSVFES